MSNFQAEHQIFVLTVIATAAIAAGDLVKADGTVAANAADGFAGFALADAAIGEATPVLRIGVVNLLIDSGSGGIAAGDRVDFASDGIDVVAGNGGFGVALDAGVAAGYTRVLIGAGMFVAGAALTAVVGGSLDTTWGAEELAELQNVITRQGEIEAVLQAHGLLA